LEFVQKESIKERATEVAPNYKKRRGAN